MPKFPDPTKNYSAEPVSPKLESAKLNTQPYTPPRPTPNSQPNPIYSSPSSNSSVSPKSSPPTPPTPPNPSSPTASPPPQPLSPQKSLFRFLPVIFGFLIFGFLIFGIVKFVIPKNTSRSLSKSSSANKSKPSLTLTYWGLWEPQSVFEPIIADYERQHPGIKIIYKMQSPKNFRTRLQAAVQQKNGPDIVRIHNTWLPMLASYLSPAPAGIVSQQDLNDFYPVFLKNFVVQGKVYALPLMVDGLALYYNTDIFQQAHLKPPKDWNELRQLAYRLTVRDPKTRLIERAGVALGTAGNIPHWSDVLGLLMLQNSADPAKPDSQEVQDALTFYTIFSTKDKVWDSSQPNSIQAFATGSVAMIFAPSWQAYQIKTLNPDLNFKIIPTPSLPDTKISWASYWVEAVTSSSSHPKAAWEFLKYLSSPEVLQKLYQQESLIRGYGEPYPRKSMANLLKTDPINAAYVSQAPNYTSWFLADLTHDNGLNDQLIKYYQDAVNAINQGQSVASIVSTLDQGVRQVLTQYSLSH